MRLLRLDIHGFGRLRGRIDLDPGPGHVGLVLENNESGKSTLSAALLAALYGLDGDRRRFRGTISDADRYRPWQGGPYGLTLTLLYNDEELVVERDFERDTVRVLLGGRDVSDQFQRDGQVQVGRGLTGLRKEQFTASCFVGQGDILWTDPSHLTDALQRVADSRSGKSTAANAIAALDRALAQYDGITLGQPGRVDTEIKRCEDRLTELRTALETLEVRRTEIDARFGQHGAMLEEQLWPSVQRRALRVRRLRRELSATEELLAADDQVGRRVREVEAFLGENRHLDAIDDRVRASIETARRERERILPQLVKVESDLERWREQADRNATEMSTLGVRRVPTREEVATLGAAWRALDDLRIARKKHLDELEREKRVLEDLGISLTEALALAHDFDALDDEQRVDLVSHTPRLVELDGRRQELETEISSFRRELEEIARAQDGRRRLGLVVLGAGIVTAAVVFALGVRIPVPALAGYGVSGAIALAGIVRTASASRHRRREEEIVLTRLRSTDDELRGVEAERADLERTWDELAASIGVAPTSLEQNYRNWRRVESRVSAVVVLRARLDELTEEEQRILTRLAQVATIFQRPPALDQLGAALQRASEAVDLDRSRQAAEHELARQRTAHEEVEATLEQADVTLLLALDEVGVPCEGREGLLDALAEYDRRNHAARERAQRRDHELPALRARRLDPARRAEATERAVALREELPVLEAQVRERAAVEGERGATLVASLESTLGQSEFEREMAALDADFAQQREQLERARAEIATFLARYGDEAGTLRAEIERHSTALRRAEQFRDAVTLARETLHRLGQQTHRIWAGQLNRHANELLRSMGSEVEDLRFDDTLAVQLRQRGHVIANSELGRVLSTGAAEAVFLAARLAVARALGHERIPLPLVLDDPFANADDERLLASLRLLVDAIAPRQQVLLMACQHSRYEWSRGALDRSDLLVPLRLGPVPDAVGEGDTVPNHETEGNG